MNDTLELIHNRRSVRAYQDRPVERETVDAILQATMRAPTAGNMMLYSIIEVAGQSIKDQLATSCDNQPFIARAPLVLLFLADYQRWIDAFGLSGVPELCQAEGKEQRFPAEGDLMLACCDALVAAQTAVLAAESLGLGSCYIGDIIENYEFHRDLFDLPPLAFPIAMLCMGYPRVTASAKNKSPRFPREIVCFTDRYKRLDETGMNAMFATQTRRYMPDGSENVGRLVYRRKFSADFSIEMTRSVRAAIRNWNSAGRKVSTE